jgi:hypothetical protein
MSDIPKFFTINGPFDVGPPLSWHQRLRWWAIRKIAGSDWTVLINAEANERGSIRTGARPVFLMAGCHDVRLTSDTDTARHLYHEYPYNITEERW